MTKKLQYILILCLFLSGCSSSLSSDCFNAGFYCGQMGKYSLFTEICKNSMNLCGGDDE